MLQTELTVGAVGDKHEQEADRFAASVVAQINDSSAQEVGEKTAGQRLDKEGEDLQMSPMAKNIQRMGMEEEKNLQMMPTIQQIGHEDGAVLTHAALKNRASTVNKKEQVIARKVDIDKTVQQLDLDNKKPKEVNSTEAENIGQTALQTIGYEKLMAMATEAGFIEKSSQQSAGKKMQAKMLESRTKISRQTMATTAPTFWGVFGRYAATAGVTSQVDSPAPGPADVAALGILAIGLIHAGYTVLMASHGNPADTGIINEANELIRIGQAATICAALALLMQAAKAAKDKGRIQKIKKTQKTKGCRHSRHS